MNVHIFTGGERGSLFALAIIAGVLAWLLGRRGRAGLAVIGAVTAAAAAGALVLEQLIALAVSAAAPEQVDFNEYRWVLLAPWGRLGVGLGLVAVALIIALAWRTTARIASPWRRAAMVGLRSAAALTALILFLEPAVELRQVASEPNRIALLVDDSRSMALGESADGPTRAARARTLLDASAPAFDAWRKRHHLDVYTFSDALTPSSLASASRGEPTGKATLIRQALEQVRARYEGRDLAGVVLISDGVGTGGFEVGAKDGASRDFLASLEAKVHTVWVGRQGLKDVAIAKVMADEFAFVRTVVRLEAVVRTTGYAKRRIPVTLSSDGKPLRQQWIELEAGVHEAKVVFELTPPRVGKYVYEIATPVAEDEAVSENNRRFFVLRVIRDKIRVLQVAGAPSWDVRALRRMLEQNPNVDLISFFILRTHDDVTAVSNDEMSLIPFPTRELFQEELPSFDLIVLQNFEYGPYGIGVYLENIRSYVEGGGGLVMLGGDRSFSSGGYADTPVAQALPVELLESWRPPEQLLDTEPFSPQLTEAGRAHPVTSLRFASRDNVAAWAALPALRGTNIIASAKPDSTVLAVHPRLRLSKKNPLPVMVVGEYGQGRSLVVTTDSLWRWGFVAAAKPGDDGRAYDKLWENSIRWLIHDPELRYLHVESDAVQYEPGAPVRLDVRLTNREYTPLAGAEVAIEVRRGADPNALEEVTQRAVKTGDAGDGSVDLGGLEPGVYRARATATVAGKEVEATDIFMVREGSAELDRPDAYDDTLAAIAARTGGTHLAAASELPSSLPFAPPRIVRVDRRADVELWSRPGLLLAALLFLGLEWLLRQRSGYL